MAEKVSHYIPYFTRQQGVRVQYAACGEPTRVTEHTDEPTCPGCHAYVEADAAQPERSADDLFGSAVHDTPDDVEPEFDPCANPRAERNAR